MPIGNYLVLITAFIQIYFSFKVFKKGILQAKKSAALFLLVSGLSGLLFVIKWLANFFYIEYGYDTALIVCLDRFEYAIGALLVSLILLLSIEFPEKYFSKNLYKNLRRGIIFICFVFFFCSIFIDDFIYKKGEKLNPEISETNKISPFFIFFGLYMLIFFGAAIYILYKKYKIYSGKKRLQMKYLLIGAFISIFLSFFFNAVLRLFFYDELFWALGYISTLILAGVLSYLAINLNLMGIRYIISRVYLVVCIAVLLYISFFGVNFLYIKLWKSIFAKEGFVIGIPFAIIFIFILYYLRKFLEKINDYLFFHGRNPKKEVEKFSVKVNENLFLDNIIKLILKEFSEILRTNINYILIQGEVIRGLGKKPSFYWKYDSEGKRSRVESLSSTEKNLFKIKKVLILDGEIKNKKILKTKEMSGIGIVCPLIYKKRNIGLISFKERRDGYSNEEVEYIEFMNSNISATIENTLLYEEVKILSETKTQFISMASHQLKTPITISRGFSSILLDHQLYGNNKEIQDYFLRVDSSLTELNVFVEDILNVSRIEGNRFFLDVKDVDIYSLIKKITQYFKKRAKERGLSFLVNLDPTLKGVILKADESKIFEVIYNLVSNAIRYTEKGGVKIEASIYRGYIILSVDDTGIGIPEEERNNIFKRFVRLENAKKFRPSGTGIGLYITKKIVDAHKGEIWFESKEGKGSTFFVKLFKTKNQKESR